MNLYNLPDHPPASFFELGEAHPDWSVHDLSMTCWKRVSDWLLWGANFAGTADPAAREKIIKAILLVETNGHMGELDNARQARATEAHRFWLNSMSGEALAKHCQRVLDEIPSENKKWPAYLLTRKQKREAAA